MVKNQFLGAWRIVKMELWDRDDIDLVVPGHITFEKEGLGEFQFGTVRGWLDCRFGKQDGHPLVEFSWEGEDDMVSGCGRGWAVLIDRGLEGRLFIHCGDDSSFKAVRKADA